MVGRHWHGVVVPVEGALCYSGSGMHPVKAGLDWMIVGDCSVGEYFLVGVGVLPCVVQPPLVALFSQG